MFSSLLLFHNPQFDLAAATLVPREHRLTVSCQPNRLLVTWQEGPELHVCFASEDVRREAEEIGELISFKTQLAGLDTRFEITFDDLRAVLDETNTLIEVQAALQDTTGGFAFNSWNGQLIEPVNSTF